MCVAIPARIKSLEGMMAEVEVGGISRKVSVQFTPEVRRGEYVLIHAGFAIHIVDEQEAEETLKIFEKIGGLEEDSDVPVGDKPGEKK